MREILHVDLDAFFASVEQRDDPRLRGKPVIVGGPRRRGVVATASYEARRFGVHSAMPMAEALRRCPQAVVVAPRRGAYQEASERVFAIFARFTPLVEGLSLDEAFLDVTASRSLFGSGESIARAIKDAIHAETELTASAGVASCKFVAKVASDLQKPDGLVVVPPERVQEILWPLPLERMWGVGPVAAGKLRAAGLRTIGDLARASPDLLEQWLGSWGRQVHELARGIDDRPVEPGLEAKSVGAEETFARDLTERTELERRLLSQSQRVARRLLASQLCGRTVVVKVKDSNFELRTRRMRLPEPVADTDSIYAAARRLLAAMPLAGRRVRLTGVAVTDLAPGPPPRGLFPDPLQDKRQRIETISGAICSRFGSRGVTRATLLEDDTGDDG